MNRDTAGLHDPASFDADLHPESLDPADWDAARALAHQIVDAAADHLQGVRDRPVWREMPERVRAAYCAPVPKGPQPLRAVWEELKENLLPYSMGNVHPRFWMWYMGSGSFTGALGEFLAAIEGSNLGGGNNAATLMDAQVVAWIRTLMGFPETASGTLVDGGSKANIIGLAVARNAMAGVDVREEGLSAIPRPLRFYASDQVHACHQKAVELLGLGNRALRRVASDRDLRLDVPALEAAITADRAAGFQPACIIATAGTTNTGAIDDLPALEALARRERLWFHVDGCIGALLRLAPRNLQLVAGIERADSLALDLHKWLHVPFEAGCALVRDARLHRGTFAVHPEYLEEKPRGAAAAEYPHDYNLQTSRGFRALKIWMTLKEHGTAKFGRLIDQNIDQARRLGALVEAHPDLVLLAPVVINIVCFRFERTGMEEAALRAINTEIMLRLQECGIAALSDTVIGGRHALRAAICNHRTRGADLELLVDEAGRLGREVLALGDTSATSPIGKPAARTEAPKRPKA